MGMFDYLTCDVPLPDGYVPVVSRPFQTKDLHCQLDHYAITTDRRLILRNGSGLIGDGLEELKQFQGLGCEPFIDMGYTGSLYFYDNTGHEYKAYFRNGFMSGLLDVKEEEPGEAPDFGAY